MAKIRIAVNHLCNDMIIGEDVYNKSGVVLVAQGSTVTDEVISLLSRHLIDSVAIEYHPSLKRCSPDMRSDCGVIFLK